MHKVQHSWKALLLIPAQASNSMASLLTFCVLFWIPWLPPFAVRLDLFPGNLDSTNRLGIHKRRKFIGTIACGVSRNCTSHMLFSSKTGNFLRTLKCYRYCHSCELWDHSQYLLNWGYNVCACCVPLEADIIIPKFGPSSGRSVGSGNIDWIMLWWRTTLKSHWRIKSIYFLLKLYPL